jgi:adenylate cyclase, class 2
VGWEFGDSKLGVSFVRLRTVGGRHFFALKRPTLNAQSCLEYETELADREQMHQAIRRMGFSPTVRVAKIRRSGKLGEIAVCVDELDGVGTFLELERLVSAEESAAAVQDELASFVTELGVEAERTEETYDTLVQRT